MHIADWHDGYQDGVAGKVVDNWEMRRRGPLYTSGYLEGQEVRLSMLTQTSGSPSSPVLWAVTQLRCAVQWLITKHFRKLRVTKKHDL